MGLLETSTQAKQLHDETVAAERRAQAMLNWEIQLQQARSWWTEHIGEPAEFFFAAGDHGASYKRKGVIAVCDGWSFYISDQDHRTHRGLSDWESGLHAYLITKMNVVQHPGQDDKPGAVELWHNDSYYTDPIPLDSLPAIGDALTKFTAKGSGPPDPETLIWRKLKWK